MRSLHLFLLTCPFALVAAQDCGNGDPFDSSCDDPNGDDAPAVAADGALALCNNVLSSCPGGFPAATACVTEWCSYDCADPNNCCASSDPSSCFQSSLGSAPSGSGSGSDPGLAECTSVAGYISSCESATSGFTTLANTAQASCFCFNENGSYNGGAWDNAAMMCYAAMTSQTSYATSELSAYSAEVVGACTKLVDEGVLSSAAASSEGTVATSTSAGSGGSLSSSSVAMEPSSSSSEAKAGTTSTAATTAATAPSAKSRADKDSRGCTILYRVFVVVFCIFASS